MNGEYSSRKCSFTDLEDKNNECHYLKQILTLEGKVLVIRVVKTATCVTESANRNAYKAEREN